MTIGTGTKGVYAIATTPFHPDESINFPAFERLIALHAEHGSCALLVMGSAGEATLLSGEERRQVIDRVATFARGKLPVFFGTTCPSTMSGTALSLSRTRRSAFVTAITSR